MSLIRSPVPGQPPRDNKGRYVKQTDLATEPIGDDDQRDEVLMTEFQEPLTESQQYASGSNVDQIDLEQVARRLIRLEINHAKLVDSHNEMALKQDQMDEKQELILRNESQILTVWQYEVRAGSRSLHVVKDR